MLQQQTDWETYVRGKNFISDLGGTISHDSKKISDLLLQRYAAWIIQKTTEKHEVAEVSNDLSYLQKKYQVSDDYIFKVNH